MSENNEENPLLSFYCLAIQFTEIRFTTFKMLESKNWVQNFNFVLNITHIN